MLKYKPDAVQIVTWNDFEEGTTIEPTVEYEFQFLDLTERFVSAFSGRKEDLRNNAWPYRIYQLRKHLAGIVDADRGRRWSDKMDGFAGDLGGGKSFLMGLKLWYLEVRIRSL
ncbi:MAG: hypothetical protein KJ626_11500 [Verrucomicrobia bacterium]|nr:hypothetical protein [Verrucomicrobiota bacterium]